MPNRAVFTNLCVRNYKYVISTCDLSKWMLLYTLLFVKINQLHIPSYLPGLKMKPETVLVSEEYELFS